jgi:hypothetical protein
MTVPFAVIVLPGPGDPRPTLESARAEAGEGTPVLELPGMDAVEVLSSTEVLAFLRAGDTWRPGALAARLRPLLAHPTAVLGVASYVLVDAAGRELLEIRAPLPPVDPVALVLRPRIEPAATLVRSAALDEDALRLIATSHGDAGVWSRLVRAHGLLPSTEIAADVALDPSRHGHAPHVRTATLLDTVRGTAGDDAGDSAVRRELLRRLFVEPDQGLADLDLAALLAPAASAAPRRVLEDLQWALERQRDALAAAVVRWPAGEVDREDAIDLMTEAELHDTRLRVEEFWLEIQLRNAEIERLNAELELRDARLERAR